jgi:hypothetical protein
VTRDAAIKLANEWYELAKPLDGYELHYEQLMGALQELLRDDVFAAAVLLSGNTPAVVGLANGALLLLTVKPGAERPTLVNVERRPLSPDSAVLEMVDDRGAHLPNTVSARLRPWTLRWPVSGDSLRFPSRVWAGDGSGPDGAERFGRRLAHELGWTIPPS